MINPFCKYTNPELIEAYEQGVKDTKEAIKDLLVNKKENIATWDRIAEAYSVCSNCGYTAGIHIHAPYCPCCKLKMTWCTE